MVETEIQHLWEEKCTALRGDGGEWASVGSEKLLRPSESTKSVSQISCRGSSSESDVVKGGPIHDKKKRSATFSSYPSSSLSMSMSLSQEEEEDTTPSTMFQVDGRHGRYFQRRSWSSDADDVTDMDASLTRINLEEEE